MYSQHYKLSKSLSRLMNDSPHVIQYRLSALSDIGTWQSPHTYFEVWQMLAEKQAAFVESYISLSFAGVSYYQAAMADFMCGRPMSFPTANEIARQAEIALRPYQKRAASNRRRLAKA